MKYRKLNGDTTMKEPYERAPYEMSMVPVGEAFIRTASGGGPVQVSFQDGLRTWSDGETEVLHHHFKTFIVPEGVQNNDICGYCGADNGPAGEYRNGFDCCICGCN